MFRLKEEFRKSINPEFLKEAEPIMDKIYSEGGRCYTNGTVADDSRESSILLPDFIYVKGVTGYELTDELDHLLTIYDKTDPDMQINSCLPISYDRDTSSMIEMYEEV